MARQYYSLLEREAGIWGVQFGDYDKGTVMEEGFELTQSGTNAADIKIIETGETQAEIDAAVRQLNEEAARANGYNPATNYYE